MMRKHGMFTIGLLLVSSHVLAHEEEVLVLQRGPTESLSVDDATSARLEDGKSLFRRARADRLLSQFENERTERIVRAEQIELYVREERYEELFLAGDEAFEFEVVQAFGALRSPQPIHLGDQGGADGTSCRACHFAGGPDGAGSSSQAAYFFGDGRLLSSAIRRDAPHVMGLGYVERLAREMEVELFSTLLEAEDIAATTEEPVDIPLVAKGISFGSLRALPGGEVDRRNVSGVSPDLVIRPFGRKGRHADLVSLVDEALAFHHGLLTSSYVSTFADDVARLGDGPTTDPDNDGIEGPGLWREGVEGAELPHGHALMLAAYLALIGVPEIHPPTRPDLLVQWTRGRELLDDVQCTSCHVERLWMEDETLTLRATGTFDTEFSIPLLTAGQEPRPRRTDFGLDTEGVAAAAIYLYSDLRRHDLGAELSDPRDEILTDGTRVDASLWLTRSLWGLADTAPYMADGRATTVHEAILWHGGEAASSRDAYLELGESDQAALRVFLLSLTRAPVVLVE